MVVALASEWEDGERIQVFTTSTEDVDISVNGDSFENSMGASGNEAGVLAGCCEQDEVGDVLGWRKRCNWHGNARNFDTHSSASTDVR